MRIGNTLADRFVLEHLAGRGGMGNVYRARELGTGRQVAIKVLHGQQGSDVTRFGREARILAEIEHPLVVRHVAHGTLPTGELYLAMEWLDGEDLAARLAREQPGVSECVALAVRIAEALAALHDRGIVHRDLKPSNIFLADNRLDRIKLLDFGLALKDTATRTTAAGTLLGTVAYMAPEQARGARELDARADVFALGCVLFECLTGQSPFAAVHATAILTRILFEEAPRLTDKCPGAPEALEAVLQRMLSKRLEERPRDGRAAAEALRALEDAGLAAAAVGESRSRARAPGITDSEKRAVAVILLDAPGLAEATAAEAPLTEAETLLREDTDALGAIASEHGGRLQWLRDGSAAVLLSGAQVATDLAAQAARCALALSRRAVGRRLALAVGQSELAGQQPMGPAIDRAVRLLDAERAAEHDPQRTPILLDDATVGLLDSRFDVRQQSGTVVLVNERDFAEVRTLLGKPTPCAGRERELRMLEGLFDDCVENGRAQAVLVTAPAGVGKSRLCRELLQRLGNRAAPAAVWIGRGDSLRAGSALGLLGQALRGACGIRDGEPLEVRREKLRARVAERVAEAGRTRVMEFLGEIIGTPFPDESSVPLRAARTDAELMREQLREAFRDFLAAECARAPVVIVLEDLHWGDRPTAQFIDRVLRELSDQPLFVLALARPEVHEVLPRLWVDRQLQEIRLKELSGKAIEQLARYVLEDKASPNTIDTLIRLSEGNAFYLEELIRWAGEGREGELPQTVVAMVQSRLGALDETSRRLLRAASVFGEVFWSGGVASLLGGGERAAEERTRLVELVERELLVKRKDSRFPGQEEYTFRHALLREGAYAMLTEEDRVLGHRLAAEWLAARGEQDALLLAEHFQKGGDGERAGRHYLRAVEQASSAGDAKAAIAHAQRGLDCGVPTELRIALLGLMCEMHYFQLDLVSRALPYAEELVRTAPRGSAPWGQAMLVIQLCSLLAGRLDGFMTALRELLDTHPSPEGSVPQALGLLVAGFLLDHMGKIPEGDAVVERQGMLARAFGDRMPLVRCYWQVGVGLRAAAVREDPASGLVYTAAATSIAEAIGHRRYIAGGRVFQSMHRWFLGAVTEARQTLEQVNMPDEEYGSTSSLRPFVLSWLLADQGLTDEAKAWATRLIASGQSRRIPLDEGRGHWALTEVLRRTGELTAAEVEIQTALSQLAVASPLDVPGALATLAAVRLAQGRTAEALAATEDGLARYASMGACSFFFRGSFLHLVHSECLEAAGRHDAACEAIGTARRRLLGLAEKISDPNHRKSFLEDVPENRRTLELARKWIGELGEAGPPPR